MAPVQRSKVTNVRLVGWALAVLVAVYLLQLGSPLRLHTDPILYLSMAASAADGQGFVYEGTSTGLPPGYPAMLAGLDRIGLGISWAFMGLNLLFLGLGLFCCYHLYRRHFTFSHALALGLCCLVLLSHLFIQHTAEMISETSFFGVSILCLYTLYKTGAQSGAQRGWAFVTALLLTAFAISIRAIGVALVPAVLWAGYTSTGLNQWITATSNRKWITLGLLLAGVVGLLLLTLEIASQTRYLDEFLTPYRERGLANRMTRVGHVRLAEWGEILLNLPKGRTRMMLTFIGIPQATMVILPLLGTLLLALMGRGLWLKRKSISMVEIYVLSYVAVLMIWPGTDVRFWLPVLPLALGWIALAVKPLTRQRIGRLALTCYLAGFTLVGGAGLIYSTQITFSGTGIADRWGSWLGPVYRAAFEGQPDFSTSDDLLRRHAYDVLIRYEPRTHPDLKSATP